MVSVPECRAVTCAEVRVKVPFDEVRVDPPKVMVEPVGAPVMVTECTDSPVWLSPTFRLN